MAIIVCNDFKTFAVYFGYLTKTRFKCCHKFYEVLSCSDRPTPYIFSMGHDRNISKLVIKLSNLFSIEQDNYCMKMNVRRYSTFVTNYELSMNAYFIIRHARRNYFVNSILLFHYRYCL